MTEKEKQLQETARPSFDFTEKECCELENELRQRAVIKLAEAMNEQDNCTPLHYQYDITPQEYADANHLPFDEGNVVKYVTRHKLKNGSDDIIKAIHYCMFILKRDYNISSHLSSYNEAGTLKQLHVYKNGNQ